MISSPDPLNDSPTFQSPARPRRSSRALQSLPPQTCSPKKQTFQLDVGNQLSPQKLRVTVEAEGSDVENDYAVPSSPTRRTVNRRKERTTTTTIPVKGLSDSEEVTQTTSPKKGRGRPRKSAGTPVASNKSKRAGTPTRKSNGRKKSIGSLIDGDDEDDVNFQIAQGVEISRGKGRSRSRSTKGAARKSTSAAKQTNSSNKSISSTTTNSGKELRQASVSEQEDQSEFESHHQNIQPDFEDMLDQDGSDGHGAPSAYSTVRSANTRGEDEPDILLARFEPGDETPRRSGWSSPLDLAGRQLPSSRSRDGVYPSPLMSPDRQSEYPGFAPGGDNDEYEEENDEVGEIREFDTILESEGFSMISVDSVPSLREHLSSPVSLAEKEPTKTARGLLSIHQNDVYEDSFSAVPEEVLAAATPARKSRQTNLVSTQQAEAADAFLSVPSDLQNGTTVAKKTLATKLLSRRSSRQSLVDNSFSSIDQEILDAATPAKSLLNKPVLNEELQREYEDSFSVIPSAVLEAATPATTRAARPSGGALNIPSQPPTESHTVGSSPGRLLTPDETPSPQEDSVSIEKIQPTQQEHSTMAHQLENDSSFTHSQLQSSPPPIAPNRFTYTAHLRNHRYLNPGAATPSIVFSSPSLPPPINGGRGQLHVAQTATGPRPPLSPIARTGQVLQNITVPSSPRSRSQSLGSPFKSPVAERRSSSILAQGSNPSLPHERRLGPLPRLDLNSQLSDRSIQPRQDDDPFSTTAHGERSPSPEQKQQYTLDIPQQRRYSDPRLDNLKSYDDSVRSDDAMSWQAEEEISVTAASSTRANASTQRSSPKLTAEQRWAAERAAVSKQVAAADPQNVIVIDSDDDQSRHNQEEGDEDFELLLETLNSSSPMVSKEREPTNDVNERPRRGKIPSPWRKNSKKLVYSDELARLSSPAVIEKPTFSRNIEKEVASQPITVRRIVAPDSNNEADADLSGWQIPEKSNFKPRVRENTNLDLSALLAASPMKSLPTLSGTSSSFSRPQPNRGKPSLFQTSCVNAIQKDSSQPSGFTPIPQKAGFNPRPRADSSSSPIKQNSFLPSVFGGPAEQRSSSSYQPISTSSVASKPLGNSSPGKANMPAQHSSSNQVSSSVSDDQMDESSLISNGDKENQVVTNSRTQKWAESLRLSTAPMITPGNQNSVSPTKSCLRSPLKTPSAKSSEQTPSKGVTFVSSSPIPSSPPQAKQLSATTWSKAHWALLDTIVQSWKPENESSPTSDGSGLGDSTEGSRKPKRRNSTRVISKLLGRHVSANGDRMKLEQWHLEAVDEFRGVVLGWEEKVIAMRVFALCVGEEQREEKARARAGAAAAR